MSHPETRRKLFRLLPPDVQPWWHLQTKADRDYWTELVTLHAVAYHVVIQTILDAFLDDTGDPK